jgi:Novel STAND NTPase 3
MSGAPVLDKEINRVIGIVSEHYRSQGDVDNNLSFATPVSSVIEVYPILKEKNPGLQKITGFLRKINSDDIWYKKIDELYVPPHEYEEVEKILREKRIVFITGTKEYGKTYTAIKLLWEYYKNGYEPRYIWERSEESSQIIERLVSLSDRLRHHVIYFEGLNPIFLFTARNCLGKTKD